MEKFNINKEMAKLKGLNIIEKCSALDDLLDDLEDAQEQIICVSSFHTIKKFFMRNDFSHVSSNFAEKLMSKQWKWKKNN